MTDAGVGSVWSRKANEVRDPGAVACPRARALVGSRPGSGEEEGEERGGEAVYSVIGRVARVGITMGPGASSRLEAGAHLGPHSWEGPLIGGEKLA